uniref:G_PROTEIN_RECEP_F1_2 domain-containing protein n=1 Tax=Panagrellus redivivus TaxID=6233 RepID=A0A7E4ZSS7_PANRE
MNNVTDATASPPPERMTQIETLFYIINGSLGASFNAIVLFIALKYADTYDKPRQIAVINMTLADLLTCLVYMITRPYLEYCPVGLCFPYYVTIFTSQLCSCLNLLWLNLDKLIYIMFPLHYYTMVSRKRVLLLSFLSWGFILGLALLLYSFMVVKDNCSQVVVPPQVYSVICIIYITIILMSFAISAVIYLIARNSRRTEPQAGSKMFKRLFFVFSSTIWTCITCLPYRLLYLMFLSCPWVHRGLAMTILYKSINIFFPIVVVGIMFNPIITIMTQRMYRECLLQYLHIIGRLFEPCGIIVCNFEDTKTRRRSRPSIATQRSSAVSRHELPECNHLNEADV